MIYTKHPDLLDECLGKGKTEIDYTLNPYYLRLDLDGDGGMDYVTFVANNAGAFRLHPVKPNPETRKFEPVIGRSLLVCFSNGTKVIYRGVRERVLEPVKSFQDGQLASSKDTPSLAKKKGQSADGSRAVSGGVASVVVPVSPPWIPEDMVLTEVKSSKEKTIDILFSWYPRSKTEILELIDYFDIPMESGDVLGEGIGEAFRECLTLGFWDGKQFRWLMLSISDQH